MLKLAPLSTLAVLALVAPISTAPALAQRYVSEEGQPRVALVKMPYTGARNVSELSAGPDYLEGGGLVVRDLGGAIGRASALKMCYAAVTKGTSALQFAQLAAAGRLGVGEALAAELEESQGATYAAMRRALPGLPAKAPRWIEEMRQIAATFESVGVPGDFHRGAAALYELLSATPFAAEPEEAVDPSRSLETTVAALVEVCSRPVRR